MRDKLHELYEMIKFVVEITIFLIKSKEYKKIEKIKLIFEIICKVRIAYLAKIICENHCKEETRLK